MPRRFPPVAGPIHRALLRRHPYAVFFRIRTKPVVVVLAVIHQRRDPATGPR
jgi:plasmid stabilization system protein ParE